MWCALHLLRWKVLYGPCLYNFAQSFVSNYKISFSAKIIKGFRSKGNFAVFIAVQTNFYLIQSDKMPSFLLHTGGGNLPDTGQKTGGRHFNLPDSDQNMCSQPEKVELLKTNNEKSLANSIFLQTVCSRLEKCSQHSRKWLAKLQSRIVKYSRAVEFDDKKLKSTCQKCNFGSEIKSVN